MTKADSTIEPRNVLVVDDDPYVTDLISAALRYTGHRVDVAHSGLDALQSARDSAPDLAILDVMVPDCDGFEICRRMRDEHIESEVLFLTARDGVEDRVKGLTIGGGDYVVKPFSLDELMARVEILLGRSAGQSTDPVLTVGELELDTRLHRATRAGEEIALSPTEFKLLRYLMANPDRAISKTELLDHVWNYDFGGDANIVETYVSYLRKKLDPDGSQIIKTVRGVGYVISDPNPAADEAIVP